eukprot:32151-Eustigmatos_ZCMA.PRE.1
MEKIHSGCRQWQEGRERDAHITHTHVHKDTEVHESSVCGLHKAIPHGLDQSRGRLFIEVQAVYYSSLGEHFEEHHDSAMGFETGSGTTEYWAQDHY